MKGITRSISAPKKPDDAFRVRLNCQSPYILPVGSTISIPPEWGGSPDQITLDELVQIEHGDIIRQFPETVGDTRW